MTAITSGGQQRGKETAGGNTVRGRAVGAETMRVLGISGSLQTASSNTVLLRRAAELAPEGTEVEIYRSLGTLPHFNPDVIDAGELAAVAELRSLVANADAVVIATPEFAHGMPGSLKNAVDWMVGTGELYGKPVAVLSAAPSEDRGGHARQWTEQTLRAQGADVRISATVRVHRAGATSRLDDGASAALKDAFDALKHSPA